MRALVLGDLDSRGALAAVRGLSQAGWTVGVGSPAAAGLAAASRFVTFRHAVPAASQGQDTFVAALQSAVEERMYDVLLPSSDRELLALSAHRGRISAATPYPPHSRVMSAVDKLEFYEAARAAALDPPRLSADDSPAANGRAPFVVKCRLPTVPRASGAAPIFTTAVLDSPDEAARHVAWVRDQGGQPLFQEYVEGRLIALVLMRDYDGRILARVQQVASRRQTDPGASLRALSVPVDEELARRAEALLESLDWFGIAELQFLETRSGHRRVIDLNVRSYGSMELAIAAGCNLPALWASAATGERLPILGDGRPGVRYHWLDGELAEILVRSPLRIPAALAGSLRYALGAHHSIVRRDDLRPAFVAARARARWVTKRVANRLAG